MNKRQALLMLLCAGMIVCGIVIGGYIHWDKGNAALPGALAGFLLFAFIGSLLSLRKKVVQSTPRSSQQPADAVAKKVQQALEQEQARITRTPLFH